MAVYVNPTFLLKGIDYYKVLSDYHKGVFTRNVITKTKIQIANYNILAEVYSTSTDDRIFSMKDCTNNEIICTTSGYKDVEIFTSTGGNLQIGGRCEYCRDDYTTETIGYPLYYKDLKVLTNQTDLSNNGVKPHCLSNNGDDAIYKVYYTFWVEGRFCSFECALSYINNMLSSQPKYRDVNIRDADKLLKFMYKCLYPDAHNLTLAQDPRLLLVNGGSLTREEWLNKKNIYKKTNNIIMIPVKVEYVRDK